MTVHSTWIPLHLETPLLETLTDLDPPVRLNEPEFGALTPAMLNLYRPPAPLTIQDELHARTPVDEYDLNFCFAAPETELRTRGGVLLTPVVPVLHAEELIEQFARFPAMFDYLPYKHTDLPSFLVFLEYWRRDSGSLLFVAYDLSLVFPAAEGEVGEQDPRRLAGLLGYIKGSEGTRSIELAHLSILPPFHRTHVTSHACCLLLAYALNAPSPPPALGVSGNAALAAIPGLGLRRAQWFSNLLNAPSISCALRLGFQHEGSLSWERVLPPGSASGLPLPAWAAERERKEGREMDGRHSWVGGLDWVMWEEEGRSKAEALVEREVKQREWKA